MKNLLGWTVVLFHVLIVPVIAVAAAETTSSSSTYADTSTTSITTTSTTTTTTITSRELQSSSPRVIAEIYECDEDNNPIPDITTPRKEGYEMKICVKPNTPTRNRDVFVKQIEKMACYKISGSATQEIVANTNEVNEKLTLVLCIPGSEICTFKTRLRTEFFYGRGVGNVTCAGEIGMQFGSAAVVQNAVNDFAGFASVNLDIPVEGNPPDNARYNDDGELVYNWWYDSPWWLRALIIAGAILLFLICCCICIAMLCWAGGYCDDERIKTRRKHITQRIVETYDRRHQQDDEEEDLDDDDEPEPPKKKFKPPRQSIMAPEDEMWDKGQANPNDYETNEFAQIKENGEDDDDDGPNDDDVCFDAEEHPGTAVFETALDKVVAENPTKKYGPPIYRAVKKQLPNRRFFVCDDEEHPDQWREIEKQELIDEIGRAFTEAKRELRKKKAAKNNKRSSTASNKHKALTNG